MNRRTARRVVLALMLALVAVETLACFGPFRRHERREERRDDRQDERQERRD